MGVLVDVIVAPADAANDVCTWPSRERTWPWVDVKGLALSDFAILRCLLEGEDPDEPVTPAETLYNPFTKTSMPANARLRSMRAFWMSP